MEKLYIFTGTFPYSFREAFLEQEIETLVKVFDQVTFIPLGGEGTQARKLPKGVITDSRLLCGRKWKIVLGLLNIWRVFPSYFGNLICSGAIFNPHKLKIWCKSSLLASFYLQSKPIRELKKNLTKDDVLYYYWGVDYNCIAPFFKGKCKQVSRFHGDWDLWCNGGKTEAYSPCRVKLLRSLSCAITISEKGKIFLKERYPWLNVQVYRLGSTDNGIAMRSNDGKIRILSCSSVYPIKRVDLIYECVKALALITKSVMWTHIGNGRCFDDLKEKVARCNIDGLEINLVGRLKHDDVMKYYQNHPVDVFVNLSTNEGIPVAVMEAISFNIPVVATDVGATSEIVKEETGILVAPNPTVEEVVKAIKVLKMSDLSPRNYWMQCYNAKVNYQSFAKYIKSITV